MTVGNDWTVLMAMYGDGKTITTLGILRKESASNQACCALIVNPDICDYLYLFYALEYHRPDFIHFATGGAQRNLSGILIRNFAIRVPPLPEQKAIARILSSLDDKIELNQEMNRTLEASARAIFKSWFVDFKFEDEQEGVVDISQLRERQSKAANPREAVATQVWLSTGQAGEGNSDGVATVDFIYF